MKKSDFKLKVNRPSELNFDTGGAICVSAWDNKEKYMIDQHVTEYFEELVEVLELDEVTEGTMFYDGNKSVAELKQDLINLGYQVI